MRRAIALPLVLGLSAGCWLVSSLDETPADAGPDADAAPEAAADAGDAADASDAGGFCAQHPAAFCADFDDGGNGGGSPYGPWKPVPTTDMSVSQPYSILATAPADAGPSAGGTLIFTLSQSVVPQSVHVEVDARRDAQGANALDLYFAGSDGGVTGRLEINVGPGGTAVYDLSGGPPVTSAFGWDSGWVHVVLDVSFVPTPTFSLTYEGAQTNQVFVKHPFVSQTGLPRFAIGNGNGPGSLFHFDNVLVDWDAGP